MDGCVLLCAWWYSDLNVIRNRLGVLLVLLLSLVLRWPGLSVMLVREWGVGGGCTDGLLLEVVLLLLLSDGSFSFDGEHEG